MHWLDDTAKKRKSTKKQIIVEALVQYKVNAKKAEFTAGFKRAAKDPEMLTMAEEGMDDYLNQLKSFL
ncbi:CopG family transcriptional regulator [Candidatus Peregrinibacteria bacterium]|nr:CopG family transcriptional regulator [Candidatus Peregrinibacteria bacterium]